MNLILTAVCVIGAIGLLGGVLLVIGSKEIGRAHV